MNLKNLLRFKVFFVSMPIIAIVVIFAVFYFRPEAENEFQKEEMDSETESSEWKDTPASVETSTEDFKSNNTYDSTQSSVAEEYPKIVEESDTEVVIDFLPESPESSEQQAPPEVPVSQDDATNPSEPPSYKPEDVNPESSSPASDNDTPAPGSSNENGAVYDPVFGWVVPGEAQQTIGDSDGDINNIVGNMGN